jgi:DNA-binding NarL/FixJ family response regulator
MTAVRGATLAIERADLDCSDPSGRRIFDSSEWDDICAALHLSPRESQILLGVFDDLSESGIARELGISTHTVHTYFERLYRKVGVSSRPALLIRVFGEYLGRSPATCE